MQGGQEDFLLCARQRFAELQSWRVKGFWLIPGTDIRVQIVEWDKLLEFIVQKLILPQMPLSAGEMPPVYDEISLGKIIHAINNRPCALPPEHSTKTIQWAHRSRNKVVHDIQFNFNDPKEQDDLKRAIEVLESTCSHILHLYEVENNWEFLGE